MFIHLLSVDNIVGVALCGSLPDLSLPEPAIQFTLPALNANMAPFYYAEALSLLEEYADLFSEGPYDFGLIKGTSHQLKLEDSQPFRTQSYQKIKVEEAHVAIELRQLLDAGLLQPSKSPWASPLLLLRKKDGGHRVVMDFRRLNSITKKDSYPVPQYDDSLSVLGGSKYFLTMDLASG